MGLFDLFSNDTAEEAARQRNQGLQQGYDALSTSFGQGRDALNSEYGQGRTRLQATTAQPSMQRRDAYGNAGNIYAGLGDYFKNNMAVARTPTGMRRVRMEPKARASARPFKPTRI
jgi:hypothetical protein